MWDEKLSINRFIGNFSSYKIKFLFVTMSYICKVYNPTILNLYTDFKKKISLGLLDYRPEVVIT